jgi:TolB-like protein
MKRGGIGPPNSAHSTLAAPRLAILPFTAGAGVPAYLCEALTQDAGQRLREANTGALSVIESDSVATLTRRPMSPAQIGAALQADLVLKGELQMLPGRYRLRIEMLRGDDGSTLWCDDQLLPLIQGNDLSAELVNRVIQRLGLGVTLSAGGEEAGEPSQEAYELVWRAHSEWKSLQRHQMQDGLRRLVRAVELAPHWLRARVEFVNLCAYQAEYGFMAPQVAARLIQKTAVGADDVGNEALLPALGWIRFHVDRNLPAAVSAFARSAHLPHDWWLTRIRVNFALSRHRFGEAIGLLEQAIALDPYSAGLHARLAWALHLAGEAEEAVERIDFALREFPGHELTKLFAVQILSANNQAKRAVTLAEDLVRICPYLDPALSARAYALACAGEKQQARQLLEELEWLSRERYVMRTFTPAVYVELGELDAAVEELTAFDRQRCPWFFQILADPRLKPLAGRDDFEELAGILPAIESGIAE